MTRNSISAAETGGEVTAPEKLRISLVNMPFADWNRPSLALAQLGSMTLRDFAGQVEVDVCYLNQDMALFLGPQAYETLSAMHDHVHTGLGDWLFRQLAFPDTADNSEQFFHRYYPGQTQAAFRGRVLELRKRLRGFCEELIERYRLADADIVGFTSMFAQHVPSIALARLIKERSPSTLIVIGGANCEAPMGAVTAELVPVVDFVFAGPALETFPAFLRCVLDGRPEAADDVPGIVSRRNCGRPGVRTAMGRDHDINDACLPDYDSFLRALDERPELQRSGRAKIVLPFETSRGCWWGARSHCTFCGLNGQNLGYRSMAPELAIEQFHQLFGYADRCTALFCTDNIMPKGYPAKVFDQIETPADVSIFYEVKLPLSRQDMKRMVAAGVTKVQPGIEALSTANLKIMAKGTTAFHNVQFLKNCREFGIDPSWNLLIGFPREDPVIYESYVRDIPRLIHLPPPSGAHMIRFDRYSPYFTQRDDYGLDLHPMDHYELIYPFGPESLTEMAYFFTDRNLAPYTLNAIKWHDRLNQMIRDWQAAWASGKPQRELRLDGSELTGWRILDSRSGTPVSHDVDQPMSLLIRKLTSPARAGQLTAEWEGGTADAQRRLGWLREQAMLFEEDDRILSLVMSDAADEPSDEEEAPAERQNLIPAIALRAKLGAAPAR
jgi:magnesium-protoporphyrin IX monomethyl ester (oxidative) cyclase